MLNVIETSAPSTTLVEEIGCNPQFGELLEHSASIQDKWEELLQMPQLIRTILKGERKTSHLVGSRPKVGDPKFDVWDEEDSIIMAWLWNSMIHCIFLATAKDIWDAV